MIYLCHQMWLDILVRDPKRRRFRDPGPGIQPYFMFMVEPTSKAFPSAAFTDNAQDEIAIDSVIRYACLFSEQKPIGGLPNQVWPGNCREFVSDRTKRLARSVGIKVSNQPERIEFQETLNTLITMLDQKLWSQLPGYLGARAEPGDVNPQALLTIAELEQEFWNFIDRYHHQKQEALGFLLQVKQRNDMSNRKDNINFAKMG